MRWWPLIESRQNRMPCGRDRHVRCCAHGPRAGLLTGCSMQDHGLLDLIFQPTHGPGNNGQSIVDHSCSNCMKCSHCNHVTCRQISWFLVLTHEHSFPNSAPMAGRGMDASCLSSGGAREKRCIIFALSPNLVSSLIWIDD